MMDNSDFSFIRLRPRLDISDLSRGRTVLSTSIDGTIAEDDHRQGLYVYETRMLSKYRWLLNQKKPTLSAAAALDQHSWLGYYIVLHPQMAGATDAQDPLQQTIELRITRMVGEGMQERVELTNHTQTKTTFDLDLEVDGDFTSQSGGNQRKGRILRHWEQLENRQWRLVFDYKAKHRFEHHGEKGVAKLQRGIALELRADSVACHHNGRISFVIDLAPHGRWQASLRWVANLEGNVLPLQSDGKDYRTACEWSMKTREFLTESTLVQLGPRRGSPLSCSVC